MDMPPEIEKHAYKSPEQIHNMGYHPDDGYPDVSGDLDALMEYARQDDWHRHFVGSDLRVLIERCKRAENLLIRELEAEVERLRADAHKWQTYTMETTRSDLIESCDTAVRLLREWQEVIKQPQFWMHPPYYRHKASAEKFLEEQGPAPQDNGPGHPISI
jgi:hypothetical protein